MNAMTYAGPVLAARLGAQFPLTQWPAPIVMNGVYCAATRAWVEGLFAKYFFDYLAARDDKQYSKRGNQCEHFALRAMLEAVDLFSKTDDPGIPSEAESLAVAVVKYQRADGRGWHEVNVWWIDGQWQPWEPQTMTFFEFALTETATVQQAILA